METAITQYYKERDKAFKIQWPPISDNKPLTDEKVKEIMAERHIIKEFYETKSDSTEDVSYTGIYRRTKKSTFDVIQFFFDELKLYFSENEIDFTRIAVTEDGIEFPLPSHPPEDVYTKIDKPVVV